ncbi:MAG: class I SAM-dependent methyltransferase [Alphaproteobacteria bacterium]
MSTLKEKILRRIAREGPISVAQYMEMALYDPEHGFYMKGEPIGARGDFITAPEVSQMFGELIGLWFVQAWEDHGRPKPFLFLELGPGRGTLMTDMLRAARLRPQFAQAAEIVLVETSPALRQRQKEQLKDAHVTWRDSLFEVQPDRPVFLVANEFLDALPARQAIKTDQGWRERLIGAAGGGLAFVSANKAMEEFVPPRLRGAPAGAIFEFSPEAQDAVRTIASIIAQWGGVALLIDYGHEHSAIGDTLQAVKEHAYADALGEPGGADLTAHIDFEALGAIARAQDTKVFGPEPQGSFLEAIGIRARAKKLKEASPARARDIDAALDRLTSPTQMGTLFKVMAIAQARVSDLAGLSCSS